jgi:hypothetical protein
MHRSLITALMIPLFSALAAPESAVTPTGAALSPAEADGLRQMREEEKLARDVYLALYAKWQLTPFSNIAHRGETHHMGFMADLLKTYGVEDPVRDDTPGEFTSRPMRKLYQKLTRQGAASLEEALKVGVEIEELDIADLRRLRAATGREDIRSTYDMLIAGSERHLQVFMSHLKSRGGTYEPTHLEAEEFGRILAASSTSCASGGGSGRGVGGGRGWRGGRGAMAR